MKGIRHEDRAITESREKTIEKNLIFSLCKTIFHYFPDLYDMTIEKSSEKNIFHISPFVFCFSHHKPHQALITDNADLCALCINLIFADNFAAFQKIFQIFKVVIEISESDKVSEFPAYCSVFPRRKVIGIPMVTTIQPDSIAYLNAAINTDSSAGIYTFR